jgi:hydrogenase maturation protein HypF
VLFELGGGDLCRSLQTAPARTFSRRELALIGRMLARGLNSPLTSSAGRLFDAVASLLDLRQTAGFEGQAAMELEFAVQTMPEAAPYPFLVTEASPSVVDWQPMIEAVLADLGAKVPAGNIAARFHATLAEMIVAVARRVGEPKVVLTGGCFQNRHLIEQTIQRLEDAGFRPYWHQRVPPNDGGIALGQVMAARMQEGVAGA